MEERVNENIRLHSKIVALEREVEFLKNKLSRSEAVTQSLNKASYNGNNNNNNIINHSYNHSIDHHHSMYNSTTSNYLQPKMEIKTLKEKEISLIKRTQWVSYFIPS